MFQRIRQSLSFCIFVVFFICIYHLWLSTCFRFKHSLWLQWIIVDWKLRSQKIDSPYLFWEKKNYVFFYFWMHSWRRCCHHRYFHWWRIYFKTPSNLTILAYIVFFFFRARMTSDRTPETLVFNFFFSTRTLTSIPFSMFYMKKKTRVNLFCLLEQDAHNFILKECLRAFFFVCLIYILFIQFEHFFVHEISISVFFFLLLSLWAHTKL